MSNRQNKVGELSFVQISDSHMGFNKPANPDVAGTLKAAVDKINGLATPPEFMLHTGDISHLSKLEEFDTVDQILKSAAPKDVFYVPGEHDVLDDDGKQFLERYGKGTKGAGWYSFDKKGMHFIGARERAESESLGDWVRWATNSSSGWKTTSSI
jgi:3',5'-cyclic-AMP phosphodiesterase